MTLASKQLPVYRIHSETRHNYDVNADASITQKLSLMINDVTAKTPTIYAEMAYALNCAVSAL